ncbi:GNAT family N-acetyltransferase [Lentibacillus halophilus]|uniref:GNAT family N-acetyltransferase n=1 Tax=Lentibacillus halophilus TaxID=295065 RepID=A0ABN0Z986_9BACI
MVTIHIVDKNRKRSGAAIDIRLLGIHDAEAYRDLCLEAMLNSPESYTSSYGEVKKQSVYTFKVRLQSENIFTFGAYSGDELAGMITLMREVRQKTAHRTALFMLYVTPYERGKGIGRQLIQTAVDHAKSLDGVEQINLSIIVNNSTLKRFCYAMGFSPIGVHKQAVKAGDHYYDEEHMIMLVH